MNITPVSYQNNPQINFNGYVGPSMTKYVNSQLEKELNRLSKNDKKFGPFANTHILVDRVKKAHAQALNKLNDFMAQLDPKSSMEYELGTVKIHNEESGKTIRCIKKDERMGSTGEIYDSKIDVYSPSHVSDSGEITLYYIENFANILNHNVNIENANKVLSK